MVLLASLLLLRASNISASLRQKSLKDFSIFNSHPPQQFAHRKKGRSREFYGTMSECGTTTRKTPRETKTHERVKEGKEGKRRKKVAENARVWKGR
jgi:hypothetical protein